MQHYTGDYVEKFLSWDAAPELSAALIGTSFNPEGSDSHYIVEEIDIKSLNVVVTDDDGLAACFPISQGEFFDEGRGFEAAVECAHLPAEDLKTLREYNVPFSIGANGALLVLEALRMRYLPGRGTRHQIIELLNDEERDDALFALSSFWLSKIDGDEPVPFEIASIAAKCARKSHDPFLALSIIESARARSMYSDEQNHRLDTQVAASQLDLFEIEGKRKHLHEARQTIDRAWGFKASSYLENVEKRYGKLLKTRMNPNPKPKEPWRKPQAEFAQV